MQSFQRFLRLSLFSVWAVVMTALTYVLGAPALKVLRRRLGRAGYWAVMTLLSVCLYAGHAKMMAVALYSLVVLMGVFEEFEEIGLSFTVSSFFALLINSLLSAGAFAIWVFYAGAKWRQNLQEVVEENLKPLMDFNPHLQMNYQDLVLQLPSMALIIWIISIYVAVLLEGRLLMATIKDERMPAHTWPPMRPQLGTFQLPDVCIWLFIAALLGAFGGFEIKGIQALSINVLNVSLVIFFFQGIAVVSKFFEGLRLSAFWQALFMIMIVVQLFLFVSALGILDFWLGFRARMEKRASELKREM